MRGAFACQRRTISAALRWDLPEADNGKILLDHYRHQRRHFAGDDCLYHQPVTATRREKRYRPPRLRYEKAGASALGEGAQQTCCDRHERCGGEAASGVQVCRRTARRRTARDHLRQNFVRQHMRARNDWLTRLRATRSSGLASVIGAQRGEPSRTQPGFRLTINSPAVCLPPMHAEGGARRPLHSLRPLSFLRELVSMTLGWGEPR